jgi:hypothetical protein
VRGQPSAWTQTGRLETTLQDGCAWRRRWACDIRRSGGSPRSHACRATRSTQPTKGSASQRLLVPGRFSIPPIKTATTCRPKRTNIFPDPGRSSTYQFTTRQRSPPAIHG